MTPSIRTNGLKRHLKIIEWVDCYHVLEEIDDNRGIEYKCLTQRVLEYEVAKRTIVLLSSSSNALLPTDCQIRHLRCRHLQLAGH